MSIKAMSWVYSDSEAKLADRLVLLALADEADDDGTGGHPSQRRIAMKTRLAVNTARSALDRLERDGEILVRRPARQGRGHFSEYVVLMGRDPLEVAIEVGWAPEGIKSDPLSLSEERAGTRGNARPRADTDPLTHRPSSKRLQPPVDFAPTEAHATFAAEHGLALTEERDAWLDWCTANARTYAELNAGFATWLRQAVKFGRATTPAPRPGAEPVGRVNPPETVRCPTCGHLEIDCTCAGTPQLALVR